MARAPNYRFERNERDRKKAAKKAAKAEKRKAARDETEGPAIGEGGEAAAPSTGTADDETSSPKPLP